MKRVKIIQKNGQPTFSEKEDPTQWIADCVASNAWGLPDRWLSDSPMSPLSNEEKAKATDTRVVDNGLGEEVTEYFFPAEYTIEIEDLNENPQYLLEKCYENRRKEYPPIEDYLDAVVKNDEAQKMEYINKCLAVKAKYPKPVM